jgi:PAT family beta-lactamase induction signal transducer AmpG
MALPTLARSSRLRYATFFYLYFMQGVPSGFALTALVNYLTAKGLSPSVIGSYSSLIGIPWIVQLVWGPLIDRYRYSVVGHYKHWVVLTQVAAFGASLLLFIVNKPEAQVWLLAGLFFLHSMVASVQDASVDAMAILITPTEERGRVNAFMRGGILLGISFGAAALSVVLHRYGFGAAVVVQSAVLLLFTLLFFFTKLHHSDPLFPRFGAIADGEKQASGPSLPVVFRQLRQAVFGKRSLRIFGVIFLCYLCFSIFRRAQSFYLIDVLKWSDEELSVLSGTWGSAVPIVVMLVGGTVADRIGAPRLQRMVLSALAVFLVAFNALWSLWVHKSFAAGGLLFWSVADPLYSIAAFPILMAICKKQVAGSQFTAYMALINLSEIGGSFLTGMALEMVAGPALGLMAGVALVVLAVILFRYKQQLAPMETGLEEAPAG